MPKLTNAVPKYRKHRQSGQAIVTICGRDRYLGPHGTKASRLEYDRLITEWLAAGRPASYVATVAEITVVELLARYLKWAKAYYRKDGRSTGQIESALPALAILRDLYGRSPSTEFGPLALKACRVKMIERGWSRTNVNRNVGAVKRVFKWGAGEQLLPASIYDNLRVVAGLKKGKTEAYESVPILPVPEADVQATLPCLSEIVSDMVRFQRLTGCRPAEVCVIRPADLDKSSDVWRYQPESHKTEHHGKERVMFVGPKAQAVLMPYLLRAAESYCFSPVDAERKRREAMTANRKTPLSCGNCVGSNRKRKPKRVPRERYDTNSYRRSIHRACDKAKIERWSPNRLRHSSATQIRREFGLEAAQVVLGHANANVTQTYAERDAKLGIEVARKFG